MAHHVEPMDIDEIESNFDNKENRYHHSNVLPRTPCTEKGYEELDVSELNMKLRYSITPAASPMSKSLTHCVDNRYNASSDKSLGNTVVNENENNLTRSLNSTLKKSDLPLQALSTDLVDSNKNSTLLRPFDSTVNSSVVTITVNHENELDILSFPSSSSSMIHTPEATTPTKEIRNNDGGSPIMRGLKSVLSMFRSSQSPIPPGEGENKLVETVLSPVDLALPDSTPQAVASTPIIQKGKERSLSRRSSPHKESIVFNEDLEKELQWNDDSTIIFSTEKVPIHKLFFQDKPPISKADIVVNPLEKEADLNSSVEYMDISNNDLSIRDRTLNGTVSKVNDIAESDGEFVDCETTFTQDFQSNTEEADANKTESTTQNIPKKDDQNIAVLDQLPMFDATQDIIKLIDSSEIVEEAVAAVKQLDFSTTDIVNQLSELINASETVETCVSSIDNNGISHNDTIKKIDVQTVQPQLFGNQVTSPESHVIFGNNTPLKTVENVSIEHDKKIDLANVVSYTLNSHIEPVLPEIHPVPAEDISLVAHEVVSQTLQVIETVKDSIVEHINENIANTPSAVNSPLPIKDDFNEINDYLSEENQFADLQDITMPKVETSNNALMTTFNKTITKSSAEVQTLRVETEVKSVEISGPPSLLPSDVSLLNMNDNHSKKINSSTHKAITVAPYSVLPESIEKPEFISSEDNLLKNESINLRTPSKENSLSESENINNCLDNIVLTDLAKEEKIEVSFVEQFNENFSEPVAMDVSITVNSLNSVEVEGNLKKENISLETEKEGNVSEVTIQDDVVAASNSENENSKEHSEIVSVTKIDIDFNEHDTSETSEEMKVNVSINLKTPSDENSLSESENINNCLDNIGLTDLLKPAKEEKIEASFVEKFNENFSESLAMDVSITGKSLSVEVERNIKKENISLEETEKEGNVSEVTIQDEVVAASNSENENNKEHSETMSVTKIDLEFNGYDTLEASEEKKVNVSIDDKNSIVLENVERCLNPNTFHSITASVFEMSLPLPHLPQTSLVEKITHDENNSVNSCKNGDDLNAINPSKSNLQMYLFPLSELPIVDNISEVQSDVLSRENVKVAEFSKHLDITNLDETDIAEKLTQLEEKLDEEIVLSESNSPFVSMSAVEEFEPKANKEDFEKIESSFSNKHKIGQLPPGSPKIVSKGYNFNFDDIDSINPFATKIKIRMSPPPGTSNASIVNEVEKKKDKEEPSSKTKNVNRRKSMPERKKPLKAKRHFNSTFDSSESAQLKLIQPKIDVHNGPPKKDDDIMQENSPIMSEMDQTSQEITHTHNATNSLEKDQAKGEINPILAISTENSTNNLKNVINTPNDASTMITDVVLGERYKTPLKLDYISSSEQYTYFSAGISSTKFESKNVFNIPEIGDIDFNPFATKSKIRQTPPPDLDVVNPFATKCNIKCSPETSFLIAQKDSNDTVTNDSENKLKESVYNLSNCSDLSKTSDDKEATVQEVHTEDEDTLEGPFLEAEDGNDCDKVSDLDGDTEDGVDLNIENAQANEDNTEAAEMFIDAEAFEFLMNQNKADEVAYSGKESLFLKFDPLFARRVTSEGVAAALNELKRRQSTPKKTPLPAVPKEKEHLAVEDQVAGPSNQSVTHEIHSTFESIDDMNVTMSKPMMVVTPAVNSVLTPKKSSTPNRTNRLSMTFTSPAMAVIDRLLSMSGNSPSAGLDATVTHVGREHTEADQALTQLRELLAEKEINVYNLRCESKELKNRLSTLESQMKSLEAESVQRLKKVNELTENLVEKTKMNRSMAAVVEEYERTIARLISETEEEKKRHAEERNQLIRDRDEQSAHLASMEVSFSDLHSKYEKSKQVIIGYKTNEDAYKNSIKEFEDNLAKMHTNYELLKQHATSKLNHANQELEKLNKSQEAEVLKFNAMIKRKDLHITSLEESLAQKTKANEELTAICDELINKVG